MANEAQTLLHDALVNSLTLAAYNDLKAKFTSGKRFHDVMRKPETASHGELILLSEAMNTDAVILMETFRLAQDNMTPPEVNLHEQLRYYKSKATYADAV